MAPPAFAFSTFALPLLARPPQPSACLRPPSAIGHSSTIVRPSSIPSRVLPNRAVVAILRPRRPSSSPFAPRKHLAAVRAFFRARRTGSSGASGPSGASGGASGGGMFPNGLSSPGGPGGPRLLLSAVFAYEVRGASRVNYAPSGSSTRVNAREQSGRFFEEVRLFFLPEGYPASVGPSYAMYSVWRNLQNVISSMTAVMSTQALLSAVGVGGVRGQSVAAATSWVLKDGFGSLGKLITARMGGNFDSESKMYRLASDLLFDLGISLELVTPLFPGSFLFLAAGGNFVKSVSMTMGMACRNSVLQTFVLRENLGEISSKNDAQNTVANLTGLLLGIGTLRILPERPGVRLAAFWGLTSIYSFLNFKSMKSVALRTLNRQRAGIAIDAFLSGAPVPSPSYSNRHERIVPFIRPRFADPKLVLGASLATLGDGMAPAIKEARRAGDRFIIDMSPKSVDIILHRDVRTEDLLECLLAYSHLRRSVRDSLDGGRCRGVTMFTERSHRCTPTARRLWAEIDPVTRYRQIKTSRVYARKHVKRLRAELDAAGYSTSTLLFAPDRTRAVY